jgi:hypothetical protein
MGFQQELAIKMEAGKRVPLIPADRLLCDWDPPRAFSEAHGGIGGVRLGGMPRIDKGSGGAIFLGHSAPGG